MDRMKSRKEQGSPVSAEARKSSSIGSCSKIIKNIKAPLAIKSYSLSPSPKLGHIEEDRPHEMDEDHSMDREEDVASPNVMAKSIAGLLTAASMYVGIEDIQRAEQLATSDEREASEEDEEVEVEVNAEDLPEEIKQGGICGGAEEFVGGRQLSPEGNGNELKQEDRSSDQISIDSTAESRRSTLFELSIVPNTDVSAGQFSKGGGTKRIMSKLSVKFNLQDDEELLKEYSCWLLRDVLIQGHLYLTSKNLLFFAFLHKSNGSAKLTGNLSISYNGLSISGKPTRYWAVLKDHTLSLYSSATDLYFPVLTIDLRYVLKVQNHRVDGQEKRQFSVVTSRRTYKFYTDNEHAARSWSSALKKQVFATQNSDSESMSIKIPFYNIVELEDQAIVEQGLTLRIRVMESSETFALEDYFFMFFNNSGNQVKNLIKELLANLEASNTQHASCSIVSPSSVKGAVNVLPEVSNTPSFDNKVIASKPTIAPEQFQPSLSSSPVKKDDYESFKQQFIPRAPSQMKQRFLSMTAGLKLMSPKAGKPEEVAESERKQSATVEPGVLVSGIETNRSYNETSEVQKSKPIYWNPKTFSTMRNMWNAQPVHYPTTSLQIFMDDDDLMVKEKSELDSANSRYKGYFSLTDEEELVASYYTYLNRSMPCYGKIYLGKRVICFRSLIPGSKTKMILPLSDVENCYKESGFRFGYFGLVIVIHGHEELFFEFASQKSRDDAEFVILKIIDTLKPLKEELSQSLQGGAELRSRNLQDVTNDAKLKLFEDKINSAGYDIPIMVEDSPYYKTTITPKKFYTFGLLTIGSRGDVQPYIALGKGLISEGHKVVIITHAEFSDWVKKHGFEFRSIAGDPTDLMALMVQHGSMNVGLIREAASTFRGWITDLLSSAWEACQGVDVLIESPSAMAGIHIAEALQIPYFRAFTMPWTKTRSYPHAFIVPDQKRGGNYNYFTHVLFENIFWKGIHGQVNKWRVETLGLGKTNLEFMQQGKVPFLYNMSPTVFPPSVDFSEWIKVTGYWFLNETATYNPPVELVEFIKTARRNEKKLVYIGFGSIVVKNPAKMTTAIVDAVLEADVYCVLNKGWSERLGSASDKAIEIELPDCIFNGGSVPHDWLFPQMDAAVHHGGSGTTGASLRAGLPAVIKPFFGDQYFYANRIEDIGAGIALRKLNAITLSRALREVTTNTRIISRAKRIGENISKEDGVATAISFIYSEMAYAKSLIKLKRKNSFKTLKEAKQSVGEDSWLLL